MQIKSASTSSRQNLSYQSYQEGLAKLNDWREQHREYKVVGEPRRFFYDDPYIPDALKRSEIQIPVRLVADER